MSEKVSISLKAIASDIVAKHFTSTMEVGAVCQHPDGYPIKVVSGKLLSNGRFSNFWYWRRVLDDGTLGEVESGYGW